MEEAGVGVVNDEDKYLFHPGTVVPSQQPSPCLVSLALPPYLPPTHPHPAVSTPGVQAAR